MIKYLSIKQKTIGGAALLLGFFSISSQLLAIIKNKLLGINFGASEILDVYFTAFKIPDIIFLLIGTIASGVVLIPLLEKRRSHSEGDYEKYLSNFFNSFSIFIILFSSLVFFIIPFIIDNYFPGFIGNSKEDLISLTRLMLLSPIIMGIGNVLISINQKNKIFLPMAITGLFYNLSIIISILFFYPIWGVIGLGYGVVLGALFYALLQLPSIIKLKLFKYKLSFFNKKEFIELFKIALPRSFALSISSLLLLYFYSQISSFGITGLVTIFAFAFAIFSIPINLINGSYSPSVFPYLAEFFRKKEVDNFNNTARDIMSRIMFLVIPVSVFFLVFSDLIMGALYGSNKFGILDINSSSMALSLFALLIVFHSILVFMSKIYYAMGKTIPTMNINLIAAVLVISIFNLLNYFNPFIKLINDSYLNNFEIVLNAVVSFVFGYIITTLIFLFYVKKNLPGLRLLAWKRLIKKIIASFGAVTISYIIYYFMLNEKIMRYSDYLIYFLIISFIYLISFILISDLLKEYNYLNFKEKVLKMLKR